MIKKHNEKASEGGFELGMGGMLKGFGDLIDKLGTGQNRRTDVPNR